MFQHVLPCCWKTRRHLFQKVILYYHIKRFTLLFSYCQNEMIFLCPSRRNLIVNNKQWLYTTRVQFFNDIHLKSFILSNKKSLSCLAHKKSPTSLSISHSANRYRNSRIVEQNETGGEDFPAMISVDRRNRV